MLHVNTLLLYYSYISLLTIFEHEYFNLAYVLKKFSIE